MDDKKQFGSGTLPQWNCEMLSNPKGQLRYVSLNQD